MASKILQEEIARLQLQILELTRENGELKEKLSSTQVPDTIVKNLATVPISDVEPPKSMPPPPPPPGPPMGMPPPPPPLFMRQPPPRKVTMKPKAKMRPLHWTKLRKPTCNIQCKNLWDKLDTATQPFELEKDFYLELEKHFFVQISTGVNSLKRSNSKKSDVIEVLDSKRATNLSIQLNGLPKNWLSILNELELHAFTEEQIEQLKEAVPEKKDIQDIENAKLNSPQLKLGRAEQYLLDLSNVAWVEERLTCWSFVMRFNSSHEALQRRCDLLRAASFELRLDANLPKLMSCVLSIGNFMNNGTARGDAYGFNYVFLPQLRDVKNNDKNTNLLKMIGDYVRKSKWMNYQRLDISIIETASTFMLSELESTVQQFSSEYCTCIRMQDFVRSRDPSEPVVLVFSNCLKNIDQLLQKLQNEVKLCRNEFQELLEWFGLNVNDMNSISSVDFYSTWLMFLKHIY